MLTPAQCRMARAALEIGVRDLAAMAGVSAMTVTRFENGHSEGYPATLEKLRHALELAGATFPGDNCVCVRPTGYGAGVT